MGGRGEVLGGIGRDKASRRKQRWAVGWFYRGIAAAPKQAVLVGALERAVRLHYCRSRLQHRVRQSCTAVGSVRKAEMRQGHVHTADAGRLSRQRTRDTGPGCGAIETSRQRRALRGWWVMGVAGLANRYRDAQQRVQRAKVPRPCPPRAPQASGQASNH